MFDDITNEYELPPCFRDVRICVKSGNKDSRLQCRGRLENHVKCSLRNEDEVNAGYMLHIHKETFARIERALYTAQDSTAFKTQVCQIFIPSVRSLPASSRSVFRRYGRCFAPVLGVSLSSNFKYF